MIEEIFEPVLAIKQNNENLEKKNLSQMKMPDSWKNENKLSVSSKNKISLH